MLPLLAFAGFAAVGADGLQVHMLPARMSALVMMDFHAIKDAGYWDEEIREAYSQALGNSGPFRKVSELLEVNPETVRSITFAVSEKTETGPPKTLILINGQFPYEKAAAALSKLAGDGHLTTVKFQDQPVYFDHNEAKAFYFTLLDANTLLICEDKALIKEALDGIAEARKPGEEFEEWVDFESKGSAVIRVSARIPPEAKRGIANVPQLKNVAEKLDEIQFAGFLGDAPRGRLRIKTADKESAVQLKAALDGLMLLAKVAMAANAGEAPKVAAVLDKLSFRTDNESVEISAAVDREFFAEMVQSERQRAKEMRKKFRERRERRGKDRKEGEPPPKEGKRVEFRIGG